MDKQTESEANLTQPSRAYAPWSVLEIAMDSTTELPASISQSYQKRFFADEGMGGGCLDSSLREETGL